MSPKLCVISSGRNNRYGLPSQKIVKKLEGNKCKVFNTQDYGVINFVIEENSIRVNN